MDDLHIFFRFCIPLEGNIVAVGAVLRIQIGAFHIKSANVSTLGTLHSIMDLIDAGEDLLTGKAVRRRRQNSSGAVLQHILCSRNGIVNKSAVIRSMASAVLSAQTQLQRMEKDPKAGAGIYCPYSYDADSEVSKPEGGYKPFYISHFGRHGSRYFSRPNTWQPAIDCFASAHAEENLTAEGEALYAAMKTVYDAHEDMYGELAPLGAVEHREIARRMYKREKPVFRSRKRNQVRCISSVYSRCIMSMANFTEELSSLEPDLEVSYLAGRRYNNEYLNSPFPYDFNNDAELVIDSLKRADLDPHSLLSLYFSDAEIVASMKDPYEVEMPGRSYQG